jgi:hypothetical protein
MRVCYPGIHRYSQYVLSLLCLPVPFPYSTPDRQKFTPNIPAASCEYQVCCATYAVLAVLASWIDFHHEERHSAASTVRSLR